MYSCKVTNSKLGARCAVPGNVDLAVKVYLSTDNPEIIGLPKHEFQILQQLDHPQILKAYTLFEYGLDQQMRSFLVMKEIKGQSLEEV